MANTGSCYVGITDDEFVIFRSIEKPTVVTHPQFTKIVGSFRTKAGASYYINNPGCKNAWEAERLSKPLRKPSIAKRSRESLHPDFHTMWEQHKGLIWFWDREIRKFFWNQNKCTYEKGFFFYMLFMRFNRMLFVWEPSKKFSKLFSAHIFTEAIQHLNKRNTLQVMENSATYESVFYEWSVYMEVLSKIESDVLTLRFVEDCDRNEIAENLGVRVETVKSVMRRALKKLKRRFHDDLFDCDSHCVCGSHVV